MINFLTVIMLMFNMILTIYTFGLVSDINGKIVYNMDKVRHKYMKDVEFYYRRGCLDGIDYPQEYRADVFNKNSPTIWCGKKLKHQQRNFKDDLYELGQ